MTDLEIGFATVGAMLVLMALRFPIGLSLGLVSVAGVWAIRGPDAAFAMISAAPFEVAAKWELSAIPMFILMGTLAHHSGLSAALFKAARLWLGGLTGGRNEFCLCRFRGRFGGIDGNRGGNGAHHGAGDAQIRL